MINLFLYMEKKEINTGAFIETSIEQNVFPTFLLVVKVIKCPLTYLFINHLNSLKRTFLANACKHDIV